MTDEQIKKIEWLNRANDIDKKINALAALNEKNIAIVHQYNTDNKELIKKIEHDKTTINQMIDNLTDMKNEIYLVISSINDDELEAILIDHYLSFQTWEQVADNSHYSIRTVQYKHKQALDKLCIDLHS